MKLAISVINHSFSGTHCEECIVVWRTPLFQKLIRNKFSYSKFKIIRVYVKLNLSSSFTSVVLLNHLFLNASFIYPLKTSENQRFQGDEEGCIGNKLVKVYFLRNFVKQKISNKNAINIEFRNVIIIFLLVKYYFEYITGSAIVRVFVHRMREVLPIVLASVFQP